MWLTSRGVTVKSRMTMLHKEKMEALRNLPKHLKVTLLTKILKVLDKVEGFLQKIIKSNRPTKVNASTMRSTLIRRLAYGSCQSVLYFVVWVHTIHLTHSPKVTSAAQWGLGTTKCLYVLVEERKSF